MSYQASIFTAIKKVSRGIMTPAFLEVALIKYGYEKSQKIWRS